MTRSQWALVMLLFSACNKQGDMPAEKRVAPVMAIADAAPVVDAPVAALTLTKCADLAAAMCDASERCRPHTWYLRFNDAKNCRAKLERDCQTSALPGATVSDAWISGCVAKLQNVSCADFGFSLTPGCEEPPGTRVDGESCATSSQCSGGYCTKGRERCGQCSRWKTEPTFRPHAPGKDIGARCAADNDCEDGLACVKGTCVKPTLKDVGEACTSGFVGAAGAAPCKYGLWCVKKDKRSTCERQPREGDACKRFDALCLFPASCSDGQCQVPAASDCPT